MDSYISLLQQQLHIYLNQLLECKLNLHVAGRSMHARPTRKQRLRVQTRLEEIGFSNLFAAAAFFGNKTKKWLSTEYVINAEAKAEVQPQLRQQIFFIIFFY